MEPLPEVRAVAEQLSTLVEDDLLTSLATVAEVAGRVVPSCVGVSITLIVDGEPITVAATTPDVLLLDVAQYLDSGPCLASAREQHEIRVHDVLDEQQWRLFAEASAARGVRSTLSVPLRLADWTACGALNLYASEPDAFQDEGPLLAELFGRPVPGTVANADLSFQNLERARQLPQVLSDRGTVEQAVGVMMHRRGLSADEARDCIERAARSAGVSEAVAAALVISLGTT